MKGQKILVDIARGLGGWVVAVLVWLIVAVVGIVLPLVLSYLLCTLPIVDAIAKENDLVSCLMVFVIMAIGAGCVWTAIEIKDRMIKFFDKFVDLD